MKGIGAFNIMTVGILIAALPLSAYGRIDKKPESLQAAVDNIHAQSAIFPQEKIYLQPDKPYYVSGEKVYFRAFLLEALSNSPAGLSRYMYVELLNPVDSVIVRQQIRVDNARFYGVLNLPEYLPQGNYRLRAYTRFMENGGEKFFYSRPVYISDPSVVSAKLNAEYTFFDREKVGVSLSFVEPKTGAVISPEYLLFSLNGGKTEMLKPHGEPASNIKFDLGGQRGRVILVEAVINDKRFGQFLHIPCPPDGTPSLSFYPEGGYTVADKPNKVAFTATLPCGSAANVSGKIVNDKNDTVAEFSTRHEGMGVFLFQPRSGETYTAVCQYGNQTVTATLPPVNPAATALAAQWSGSRLTVKVNRSASLPDEQLYLLVCNRGYVFYADKWDGTRDYIIIEKNAFPSGISHLLLLNSAFDILSERLVFVNNADDFIAPDIQPDKEQYGSRDKIKLNIALPTGTLTDSIAADFAVSVTDDHDVVIDTATNILSEILLSSELQGYIAAPAYYFRSGKSADADLLMMIRGWNRYNIPEAASGNFIIPKIMPEISQSFTGLVRGGLLQKPEKDATVTASTDSANLFSVVETDKNGRFLIDDFEFPDSTEYAIQTFSKKGGNKVDLYVDDIQYPKATPQPYPVETLPLPANTAEYIEKADLKYTAENGMRVIDLPELVIQGRYRPEKQFKTYYGFEPDNFLGEDYFKTYAYPDLLSAFRQFPGVTVTDRQIILNRNIYSSLTLNMPTPIFIVDGHINHRQMDESNQDYVERVMSSINVNDVVQINMIKSAAKLSFYGAAGGVFEIYTKWSKGEPTKPAQKFNIAAVKPLGYQKPVEFYSPEYNKPESLNAIAPDLRTTIYWNPCVAVDSTGVSALEFYSADAATTYSVVLEGLASDGRLIYQRKRAMIKTR